MSQCGELFLRHKEATAPLGVPRVVARGVTWRTRIDATAAYAGRGFSYAVRRSRSVEYPEGFPLG
ncbi:hypothetical protein [Fischerella major]|uniref:hypothetical protein n=1 Tax=Fischerella major TaxID=210993 RepID=UPI001161129A|nr:hypothetical protein [Fischerella major]